MIAYRTAAPVLAVLSMFAGAAAVAHSQTPPPGASPAVSPTAGATPRPSVVAEPATFLGSVLLHGAPAPDGTSVEAIVNNVVCGTTQSQGGQYQVTVKAGAGAGADFQAGCGRNGDVVAFRVGGVAAAEKATFIGMSAQTLNLTAGAPEPSVPSSSPIQSLPSTGWGGSSPRPTLPGAVIPLAAIGVVMSVLGLAGRKRPGR